MIIMVMIINMVTATTTTIFPYAKRKDKAAFWMEHRDFLARVHVVCALSLFTTARNVDL